MDTEWSRNLERSTRSPPERGEPQEPISVPCLTVLWHPDSGRVGHLVPLGSLRSGGTVELSRLRPAFAPPDGSAAPRPLADPSLSRQSITLRRSRDGGVVIDSPPRAGLTVHGHPCHGQATLGRDEIAAGAVLLLADRVALVLHRIVLDLDRPPAFDMIGESDALQGVRRAIAGLADLPFPVLIRGETGTGKELVARALHQAGPRHAGPFVSVNMGAIPTGLAAAELFGAARGAYTGAERSRRGFFRQASGGTLFLDEIGEMAAELQVLLYRALESEQVRPIGESRAVPVDTRIVAATDADLEQAVASGRFRAPLLHRLSAYELEVPPMRARREDFGRLFLHFLRRELQATGDAHHLEDPGPDGAPWVSADLVQQLAQLPWPGNVRQVHNVARQIVVHSRGSGRARIPEGLAHLLAQAAGGKALAGRRYRKRQEIGEAELLDALRRNRWHMQHTADQLGISRTTLYALVEACPRVRKASDLSPEEIERCRAECGGDLDAMAEVLRVSKRGLRLQMTTLGLR